MATQYPREVTPEEMAKFMAEETTIPAENIATQSKKRHRKRRRKKKEHLAGPKPQQDTQPLSKEDALRKDGVEVYGSEESGNLRFTVEADGSFAEDRRQQAMRDLVASVKSVQVKVTNQDIKDYLLALMDNKVVELNVRVMGRVDVRIRTLSPYEEDLAYDAVTKFVQDNKDVSALLLQAHMQQFMLSMQIVSFDGKDQHCLRFVSDGVSRSEHIDRLIKESMTRMANVTGPRYRAYIAAANVFAHKMQTLDEASLNEDFWNPAFAD